MNNDYEAFCLADRWFYDTPGAATSFEQYQSAERPPPAQWEREADDHWVMYAPESSGLPAQGWKVHISGCLDNAERIIDAVWNYCVPRDLAFKFLVGPLVMLARNSKYAGRGGSGKLVTIYPTDEADFESVCNDLDEALRGEPGPYILSDLRWAGGPVHVRYGGFARRYCLDDMGNYVLAIEDETGALVPDVRSPAFRVPAWVTLPDCLAPHLEARNAVTVADIAYEINEALHFSNGGGVYRGTTKDGGTTVVLKEARPHAGLAGDGADAVTRLRHEGAMLERLAGIAAVPRLLDRFSVGEHEFFVMEHIDGEVLKDVLVRRTPLLNSNAGPADFADFAEWAMALHGRVAEALEQIHSRGVVYGDLHTFNIIERPDGSISLLDFEVAQEASASTRPGLGAMGFVAPRDRSGVDIDHYALACLGLAMFLPLEQLLGLDRGKAVELAEVVEAEFPVPREWLDQILGVIRGHDPVHLPSRPRLEPTTDSWRQVRDSLTQAILASATPERDDRLFPGDITQFDSGGLNLAHGAAGVLYALDVTGAGRFPDHEDWLIRHSLDPTDDTKLGLYDGFHGVAYVLAHLGHVEQAAKLMDLCLAEPWEQASSELRGGIAGLVLNFAHFGDVLDDPALHGAAERGVGLLADRLGPVDSVPETSGGEQPYAGLMRGSSGQALAFIHMYERNGDDALLDLAATALRQDLRRCVRREADGQLHVDEGWRTLPYLESGSVGIGLVLRRYLRHRDDEQFADALAAIRGAACSRFYIQSGLFDGRAGMILYLADDREASERSDIADQIRRQDWHATTFEEQLAFPGDLLLRLSMDLATGSAGVLLALGAALHDQPVSLPFLDPLIPLTDDPIERR